MVVNRDFLEARLRSSLEALAAPGPEAVARAPRDSARPDELALEFDDVVHAFVGSFGDRLSHEARSALAGVDSLLEGMSGDGNAELWTEDAVCSHPRWVAVRQAAQAALDALGWRAR